MPEADVTNVAEYSVSEVSQAVKRTVEDAFGYVRVRGEISGFRGQHGSGHAYFALKDEKARLEAVIWRGVYNKLKVKPEEGLEVIATGKITTYPGSSKYQIVIEAIEPAGVGALMALLEERKRKLHAEGLFDPARKQLLPFLPRVIGVVTSPTGAVIRDIVHRLSDRFPTQVLLWPVRVQGDTSSDEVARAIRGFNAFDGSNGLPVPDVLIVARGGGSLEDLWGFNDEAVVRAAADSDIPLISAVGHETDWTLIDYAADVRAPTPTGAAEMAVPVRLELIATLDDLHQRQFGAISRVIDSRRTVLTGLSRGLPTRDNLLALHRQRLDEAAGRLPRAIDAMRRDFRNRLDRAIGQHSLSNLSQRVETAGERLKNLSNQLDSALQNRANVGRKHLTSITSKLSPTIIEFRIKEHKQKVHDLFKRSVRAEMHLMGRRKTELQRLSTVLDLVSYQSVLSRGFALVRDDQNKPIRQADKIKPGKSYIVEFADGHAAVTGGANDTPSPPKNPSPVKRPQKRSSDSSDQGNLF